MVAIKVNGYFLDLPVGFSFAPVIKSPIYFGGVYETIPGTYTIPSTIDATPTNARALGSPHLLSNNASFKSKETCLIYLNENEYETGLMTVQLASSGKYKIQILSQIAALQSLKTTLLSSLSFPDLPTITNPQTAAITDDSLPYRVFRIYNPRLLEYQDDGYSQKTNYSTVETMNHWNGTDIRYFAPQVKLKYVLEQIFEDIGYSFEQTFFDDVEFAELCLYSNRQISINDGAVTGNEVVDPIFLPLNMSNFMPSGVMASTLIKEFSKFFGGTFIIDNSKKIAKFIQFNDLIDNEPVDWSDYVGIMDNEENGYNGLSLVFNIGDDDFASDHKDVKNYPNIYYEHPSTVLSAPSVANISDVFLSRLSNKYFQYEYGVSSTSNSWRAFGYCDLADFTQDDATDTISLNLSPLTLIERAPALVGDILDSSISLSGSHINDSNSGLRLCLYRGLSQTVPAYNNTQVPYANNYEYDDSYNDVFNHSLRLKGTKGIYEQHWKSWDELLKESKTVNAVFVLPLRLFLSLDSSQPIKVYDQYSGTYHKYFIVEIKPSILSNPKTIKGSLTLLKYL